MEQQLLLWLSDSRVRLFGSSAPLESDERGRYLPGRQMQNGEEGEDEDDDEWIVRAFELEWRGSCGDGSSS
jgi:hypothetical protein